MFELEFNNQTAKIGGFYTNPINGLPEVFSNTNDQTYSVLSTPDSFFFTYQKEKYLHFPYLDTNAGVTISSYFDSGGGV